MLKVTELLAEIQLFLRHFYFQVTIATEPDMQQTCVSYQTVQNFFLYNNGIAYLYKNISSFSYWLKTTKSGGHLGFMQIVRVAQGCHMGNQIEFV